MAKKISIVGKVEVNKEIIAGVSYLAKPIKSSIGPFGLNTMMEKGNKMINDGANIGRELVGTIKNPFQRRAATIALQAATATEDEALDGTSSTIALLEAILLKASAILVPKGSGMVSTVVSSETLKEQVKAELTTVVEKLNAMATPIATEEESVHSATVSTENKELGEIIGKAQFKLGAEGVLVVEETNEKKCYIEYVDGIYFDNGFSTPLSINNPEKECLELEKVHVILTNHVLNDVTGLAPLTGTDDKPGVLRDLYKSGARDVVIIARAFSELSIKEVQENMKNGFRIWPVNAPYVDQSNIMEDITAICGGRYISTEKGNLQDMMLSDVGFAKKLVVKRWSSIIAGNNDAKTKKRVYNRCEEIKAKLRGEMSEFERRHTQKRLSQLTVGLGIVKIGAQSAERRAYLKEKADDAVGAIRSAFQEGVVPGAGIAFREIAKKLPDTYFLKSILPVIWQEISDKAPEDWKPEEWVKDPVKVLRTALTNASSTALDMATSCSIITTANAHECKCAAQMAEEANEE